MTTERRRSGQKGIRMMSTRQHERFLGIAVAVLAAFPVVQLTLATPARAATDAEQAEALIREGVRLRSRDNTAQALPLFEKAYQISRTPRTAAQLGLCELELGYFVEAERYLTEALASPDHPWIAKNKGSLKKPLETARANIGELVLTVSPASADVSLNKKPLDRSLLGPPIRLGKGPADVEVRAPGYEPVRDTVTIVGGKREQRTYALVPEAKPAVAETVPSLASPAPGPVTLSTAPPPGPAGKKIRLAAWITGGAAAAAFLFGTVEAINAGSKSSAFNDHTSVANGVPYHDCGTANLSDACKSLKNDYDGALTLTIVGFAAAGALAATSAVLFVLSRPGGTERAGGTQAFGCVPDLVGRGVGCTLRF
jgi:tetratricopeptide (TPR) repeat protein